MLKWLISIILLICKFWIEIGAVLLSVERKCIVDRFQSYVRPTFNPILSQFCVDLTGITQATVDRQKPFSYVYRDFIDWLENIRRSWGLQFLSVDQRHSSLPVTFCTWSNWDLGLYFRKECQRNQITCPPYLKGWIDISKQFTVWFLPLRNLSPFLSVSLQMCLVYRINMVVVNGNSQMLFNTPTFMLWEEHILQ